MQANAQHPQNWLRSGFSFYSVWRAVTYLSVLAAFAGLFVTREIQLGVGVAFVAAWVIGFIIDQPPRWWRRWMGLSLIWIAVALAITWAIERNAVFQSILDMLLFLVIAKCFMLKTNTDYLLTQILCFFILISTAVITISFYFIIFFLAYLFFGTLAMLLYGISRSDPKLVQSGAERSSSPHGTAANHLPGRIVGGGSWVVFLVFLLLMAFFILIPHFSMERLDSPLSRRQAPPERISGFSDEVTLGEFKSITPDQTVVMRVEVSWPEGIVVDRPNHLRLRGTPLEYYDEASWRRAPSRQNSFPVGNLPLNPKIASLQRGPITTFKVYQNPDVTKRIFTVPLPMEIDFHRDQQVRYDPVTISAQITSFGKSRESTYTNPFSYDMRSAMVDEFTPYLMDFYRMQRIRTKLLVEGLQLGDDEAARQKFIARAKEKGQGVPKVPWLTAVRPPSLSPDEKLLNLQLPQTKLTEDIRRLASDSAKGVGKPEIVHQLTTFLRKNYSYTLTPATPHMVHPIEAFLFRTKEGHCEFFATALVLMLRTRGIPARLVNGFYTTEWNDLGQFFVVKQSDAHAWAEVWLDGCGWVTIDPTPPGNEGRLAYGLGLSSWTERWQEYMRIQWQRYVIDYSVNKQIAIFKAIKSTPGVRLGFDTIKALREMFSSKPKSDEDPTKEVPEEEKRTLGETILDIAILLLLYIACREIYRRLIKRRHGGNRRSGIDYFDALLQKMEKLGRPRLPGQTPAEFVRTLEEAGWNGIDLQWLVQTYYRHRYSGEAPPAPDRKKAIEIVRQIQPLPKTQQA